MSWAGSERTIEVEIDGKTKRRSLRNILGRALMEGYSWQFEQMRFQLHTADLVLDTLAAQTSMFPLARKIVERHGWKVVR